MAHDGMTSPTILDARIPKMSRQTAQYIADMVLELRNMAKAENFDALRELLELTYYEAFTIAHKVEVPSGEQERIDRLQEDVRREG